MYTGHVAIALAVRGLRRDLPLWLVVLAAQAPDWVEVICGALGARANAELWSHAFPFVVLGAAVAAVLVRLWTRSTGAALVTFAVYLSHPLADLVTGYKPLWLGGPPVGLRFIDRPVPDFVVQGSLCVLGWLLYRRSLPPNVRRRVIATAPLVTLLAVQAVSDLVVLVRKPFRENVTESASDELLPGTADELPNGRRATARNENLATVLAAEHPDYFPATRLTDASLAGLELMARACVTRGAESTLWMDLPLANSRLPPDFLFGDRSMPPSILAIPCNRPRRSRDELAFVDSEEVRNRPNDWRDDRRRVGGCSWCAERHRRIVCRRDQQPR